MATKSKQTVQRPPVGINPNVPLPVQRELRKIAGFAFDAQDRADSALTGLAGQVSKNQANLLEVSKFISSQVQFLGPGAGTYVTGAKLTGGGSNGTITIDAYGRVTAIHPAS